MRPDVGALLGADALGPLGCEAARETAPGRGKDQGDGDQHREAREHRLARRPHRAARPQEGKSAGEHERDAEPAAAHLGPAERTHPLGRLARRDGSDGRWAAQPRRRRGATMGARQIRSAPRTATVAGQTIASPGQGPAARTNSRPLSDQQARADRDPKTAARRVRGWDIAAHVLSRGRDGGWRGRWRAGSPRAHRRARAPCRRNGGRWCLRRRARAARPARGRAMPVSRTVTFGGRVIDSPPPRQGRLRWCRARLGGHGWQTSRLQPAPTVPAVFDGTVGHEQRAEPDVPVQHQARRAQRLERTFGPVDVEPARPFSNAPT